MYKLKKSLEVGFKPVELCICYQKIQNDSDEVGSRDEKGQGDTEMEKALTFHSQYLTRTARYNNLFLI